MKKALVVGITAFMLTSSIFTMNVSASELALGSSGDEVSYIQTALKELGYFDYETVTGYYGEVTVGAVKDFQQANDFATTGIVDKSTMDMLKEISPIVELPHVEEDDDLEIKGAANWSREAQYILEVGMTAEITDIDSGRTFKVKRTFGHNHADVEPLTKSDASKIKEIWGGSWSWDRHAVVVKVGDTIMAGSMAAMPHAGLDRYDTLSVVKGRSGGFGRGQNLDAVKGNGVDGHLDLHFAGSRTHGSNKIDSLHQGMVKTAARYISDKY